MKANLTQAKSDIEWINEIASHVAAGDTLDETLAVAVSFAVDLVNCDFCFIYLREEAELVLWVWKHLDHATPEHDTLPLGRGYPMLLRQHRVPMAISISNLEQSRAKVFDQWTTDPGETFVSVPLLAQKELVGIINLQHRKPHQYSLREFKLLSAASRLLGAGIGITRLERKNSDLWLQLETRKLVERGKGILQRELGLSEEEAYQRLQRQSQQKQRPIKEIAQALILSAEVRQSISQPE
jgi:uroporphyrinogen-III synthase